MTTTDYEAKVDKLINKIKSTYYVKQTIDLSSKIKNMLFEMLTVSINDIDKIVFRCNENASQYLLRVHVSVSKDNKILQRFNLDMALCEGRRKTNENEEIPCVA